MEKIKVLGSLNIDLVTNVDKTPKIGQTVFGSGLLKLEGGKGANQAVSIGKLGGKVSMIGMLGDDNFADILKENLEKNNVDTKNIYVTDSEPTGTALIMVNSNGDNSIVVVPGANFELKEKYINEEQLEGTAYLLSQFEVPKETIAKAFKIARDKGIKTILNPAPASVISDELLSLTDIIIPNETEFEIITNIAADSRESIFNGAKQLFSKGVKELIITLGSKGAFYINSKGESYESGAYIVDALDTTAAGDSFIGGLVTKLSEGRDIKESIEYAMKVGAITVSRKGAQASLPTKDEIEAFEGVKNEKR